MLVCLPGYGPSFSVSLFCSVGQVSLRIGKGPCCSLRSYSFCLHAVRFVAIASQGFVSMPMAFKLSVQEILGDPVIVHSDNMSEPAQAYLLEQ